MHRPPSSQIPDHRPTRPSPGGGGGGWAQVAARRRRPCLKAASLGVGEAPRRPRFCELGPGTGTCCAVPSRVTCHGGGHAGGATAGRPRGRPPAPACWPARAAASVAAGMPVVHLQLGPVTWPPGGGRNAGAMGHPPSLCIWGHGASPFSAGGIAARWNAAMPVPGPGLQGGRFRRQRTTLSERPGANCAANIEPETVTFESVASLGVEGDPE